MEAPLPIAQNVNAPKEACRGFIAAAGQPHPFLP
jgi:hypothetical protein